MEVDNRSAANSVRDPLPQHQECTQDQLQGGMNSFQKHTSVLGLKSPYATTDMLYLESLTRSADPPI
jgi:hypothetical protein